MLHLLRKILTKKVWVQEGTRKKLKRLEVPPSEKLVWGVCFAIASLIGLIALEIAHIALLKSFNNEIFAAITGLIGTITGVLLTHKA